MDKIFGTRKLEKQKFEDGFKTTNIPSQIDVKNNYMTERINILIKKIDEMLT